MSEKDRDRWLSGCHQGASGNCSRFASKRLHGKRGSGIAKGRRQRRIS